MTPAIANVLTSRLVSTPYGLSDLVSGIRFADSDGVPGASLLETLPHTRAREGLTSRYGSESPSASPHQHSRCATLEQSWNSHRGRRVTRWAAIHASRSPRR